MHFNLLLSPFVTKLKRKEKNHSTTSSMTLKATFAVNNDASRSIASPLRVMNS